jgi:hypothetical protein
VSQGNGSDRPRRPSDRKKAAVSAGDLVGDLLGKRGVAAAVREHRLVTGWVDIVGERVATRAWPSGLRKGVLFVRVANSAWMQELSFLREAMVKAALAHTGEPALVKDVRLHLPGKNEPDDDAADVVAALSRRKRPRRIPTPAALPDPATRARIQRETDKVADAELREAILALRLRLGA